MFEQTTVDEDTGRPIGVEGAMPALSGLAAGLVAGGLLGRSALVGVAGIALSIALFCYVLEARHDALAGADGTVGLSRPSREPRAVGGED